MSIFRSIRAPVLLAALVPALNGCGSSTAGGGGAPAPVPSVDPAATDSAAAPIPALVEGSDFAVFRRDGTEATLDDLVAAADTVQVVFFGEQHDDPVTHRVQALVLGRLYTRYQRRAGDSVVHGETPAPASAGTSGARTVVLSLEMFERDVQTVLDEYLADLITESHFLASARPWEDYENRYRPMVEFARVHGLPVVAANAPRRYVNRASRLGRESLAALPASARRWLPPLPYPEGSAGYEAEWDALMGPAAAHMSGTPFDGQTLWDATMGQSVASAVDAHEAALVLHLAGSFHVANFTGTPEALQHYRPGTRALVVVAEPGDVAAAPGAESTGQGDFVIITRPPAPRP